MVLEEAINESDGGGSNTFPSDASTPISDVDPWSSANNGQAADGNVKIDASTLPRPIPIFGGLFGFTQSALEQAISGTVNAMAQRVRRPLREEECQAIAYHTAKGAAISSYGAPIGIAAGIWRARRTRESYRFPFFKPDLKTFDPYKLGPLTGTRAQRGWHILRTVTYATVGGSLGRFLIRSYAVTVAVAGWRLDPRLKDVVETLGKIGREAAEARQRGDSVDDSRASTAQQRQHQQQNEQGQQVNFKASGDGSRQSRQDFDASPAAYPWSDGEASSASTYGDDSRQDSNIRETRSETRQSYQQQARPKQDSQRPPGRADGGAGADFDFGNYDNASPTASASYSNESAWDRIRRGGPASGGNRSAPSPAQSRADSEGSGYNAWDRARAQRDQQQQQSNQQQQQKEQYQSKEEAQRAFDAQLERERQGKNF